MTTPPERVVLLLTQQIKTPAGAIDAVVSAYDIYEFLLQSDSL